MALLATVCGASAFAACSPAQCPRPQTGNKGPQSAPQAAVPPASKLQPCLADDPAGCRAAGTTIGQLDPEGRYPIPVAGDDPVLGPLDAPVTVVVFSDFQCPYCARMNGTMASLRKEFPDQVRIVWKDLPLPMHAFAMSAALLGRAAYGAGGSRLFWEAHSKIYAHQAMLNDQVLAQIASDLGVSWPAPKQFMVHINSDLGLANKLNVDGTPTSFVNGRPIFGAKSFDVFEALVNEELQN